MTYLTCSFFLLLFVFCLVSLSAGIINDVDGSYYNWEITRKPERPYLIPYSQTLVMKIFLAGLLFIIMIIAIIMPSYYTLYNLSHELFS